MLLIYSDHFGSSNIGHQRKQYLKSLEISNTSMRAHLNAKKRNDGLSRMFHASSIFYLQGSLGTIFMSNVATFSISPVKKQSMCFSTVLIESDLILFRDHKITHNFPSDVVDPTHHSNCLSAHLQWPLTKEKAFSLLLTSALCKKEMCCCAEESHTFRWFMWRWT